MNEGAALGGQVAILKWLRSNSYLRKKYAANFAAAGGSLPAVEFTAEFEWCQTMMWHAAHHNRRDALRWLREKFDAQLRENGVSNYLELIIEAAAAGNHWDLHKTLQDSYNNETRVDIVYFAAMHGNTEMLLSSLERVPVRPSLMHISVIKGHIAVMKILLEKGLVLPLPEQLQLGEHSSFGRIDVLKFFHSNGVDLSTVSNSATIINSAAGGGHMELVKWLISIGIVPTKLTCRHAASGGHLELLKYFRKDYFSSWDMMELCVNAIEFHHLRVVRWIRGGCKND